MIDEHKDKPQPVSPEYVSDMKTVGKFLLKTLGDKKHDFVLLVDSPNESEGKFSGLITNIPSPSLAKLFVAEWLHRDDMQDELHRENGP